MKKKYPYIQVSTVEQIVVLRHIQNNFEWVGSLELIPKGIRLTDINGKKADFTYKNGEICFKELKNDHAHKKTI